MIRPLLKAIIASALLSASSIAQDPGALEKLSPQQHRLLMPVHARVLDELKKQDAELEPLLAAMKSASGEKRMDAMAAILSKLIEQRKALIEKIAGHLDR